MDNVAAFLLGWIAAMLTHILWNGIQIRRNSERIRRKSEILQAAGLKVPRVLVCASCGLELGHELNCAMPNAPKVREMKDSPLALTDEELDRIYKTITATGIRGGVIVTRWSGGPHLFAVVAPATRGSNERVISHVGKSLDADVIMHAFNNLAFLIESLRSERQAVNKLLSQRGGPNTQARDDKASSPRGLEAGAGLSAKESD